MDDKDRITIEPGKRGGQPRVRGLRITVYEVLGYLAAGMPEDQILADFPDLEREDIRACLAFATEGDGERARPVTAALAALGSLPADAATAMRERVRLLRSRWRA